MRTDVVQRLRITFAVDDPLSYISVLDMGRLWERLLRRARVPIAYSQGFNPHPRMQFATALPVGYQSDCEVIDLLLAEALSPDDLAVMVTPQCPPGLSILDVREVPVRAAAPQSTMQEAHYHVRVCGASEAAEFKTALNRLMARDTIIRQRRKKGKLVDYDLRPLILDVRYLSDHNDCHELSMVLRCGSQGAGRPEEILDELGLDVARYTIRRTRLVWEEELAS
ncbi:MAG TPA: DUF2344 domain-containing protein [Chloroflexi bacterium]|jgi:radical SAM-linked protein|nr:DUF2344 domain-containing protein [Chloroflexota bacterium]